MGGSDSGSGGGIDAGGARMQTHYDWSSSLPSTAIIESVAAVAGRDPAVFPPLYEFVDPDALNELLQSTAAVDGGTTVSFVFDGYKVTLHGDGELLVQPSHV